MSMYVPAGFVFCRCHRREFAVDGDQALERPLRLRTHHFRIHMRQNAIDMRLGMTVTNDSFSKSRVVRYRPTVFFRENILHGRALRRKRASVVVLGGTRARRDGGFGGEQQRRTLSLGMKAMVGACQVCPGGPRWALMNTRVVRLLKRPMMPNCFPRLEGLFDVFSPYTPFDLIPFSTNSHYRDDPTQLSLPREPPRPRTPPPRPSPSPPSTTPSPSYLDFASKPSKTIVKTSRKLLILDLNGTLLLRSPRPPKSHRGRQPHSHPAPRRIMRRPYLTALRAYLFAPRTRAWLDVMVWSSAQPHSVEDMVLHALGDDRECLVAIWARDTLGLAEEHYRASLLLSISP
jgi:NLI interacting factor-like phosphatase